MSKKHHEEGDDERPGTAEARDAVGDALAERKPMAGMDMLTVLGQQFHSSQRPVRLRALPAV